MIANNSVKKQALEDYTSVRRVRTWKSLHGLLAGEFSGANWAFRGQRQASWPLMSNLERLAPQNYVKEYERYILDAIRRRAHHYIANVPCQNDTAEWLALAQHHGAPTRLLDWSRSPYVALYFAIEELAVKGKAALWAIDYRQCKQQALDRAMAAGEGKFLLNTDDSLGSPALFNQFFIEEPVRFVGPLQPHRLNERITVQQGLFICAGDLEYSFETNLVSLLAFVENTWSGILDGYRPVIKLEIPGKLRLEILRELNRMNINAATLFPGIDGFAKMLRMNLGLCRETTPGQMFVEGYHDDRV